MILIRYYAAYCAVALACSVLFYCGMAYGRDLGQWGDEDVAIQSWFRTLMQPDNRNLSCCGEADAYWADQVETAADGSLIAVITDDRPDEPLHRPHVPIGTRVPVPNYKIKWDQGNPVGHIVIFLNTSLQVYCYVQNGAV